MLAVHGDQISAFTRFLGNSVLVERFAVRACPLRRQPIRTRPRAESLSLGALQPGLVRPVARGVPKSSADITLAFPAHSAHSASALLIRMPASIAMATAPVIENGHYYHRFSPIPPPWSR